MLRKCLWWFDVTQAYIQSDTKLVREDIEPPAELGLHNGKLPRVFKALYGLNDAGDYWHRTLKSVLVETLVMRPSPSDSAH